MATPRWQGCTQSTLTRYESHQISTEETYRRLLATERAQVLLEPHHTPLQKLQRKRPGGNTGAKVPVPASRQA
eukprot:CAMPEP_0204218776 /NCGR_PEP_ID=MMETSP0361-20130328/79865_1 /ASSEMBLY_ACC=CAM_ASM_000343 /TAXON_ID=268821 /ORGANISM="Scrippsiella Hangoei, Strain SHTV-5" /LENGTH=72 /DNA_ID=CAMNT_0051183987 /DNA_START=13 /DNA_END=228 /DNA_ORIENTATION=-